jgi:hypothetical protein
MGDEFVEITNDQKFYDYLCEVGGNTVSNPTVGIEFRQFVGTDLVPVIHWLDVSDTTADRPDFSQWLKIDRAVWANQPRLVQITAPVEFSKFNAYFSYQFAGHGYVDIATARAKMNKNMCATIFAPTKHITAQLTHALVWLSTDAGCRPVGAVVAEDCAIVYNNNSDLIINMPPGLIEKK